jgi:hypothetical protein
MKTFFLTIITLLVISNAQSQDLILKKTGEELKVNVIEINETILKYEKPGLTVAFTISLSEILVVTFKNGEKFIPQVSEKSVNKNNKFKITAGTAIILVANETLSSKTTKVGTTFQMGVKDDVFGDDGKSVVVTAGSQVIGTITKSEKNGVAGKKGIISFSVDYIKAVDGQRIPVNLNVNDEGKSRGTGVVIAAAFVAAPLLLLKGQAATIEMGTQYKAYTSTDREIEVAVK